MQHRRRHSHKAIFFAMLAGILVGSVLWLMFKEIPVPGTPVEKQLDAGAFLEAKTPAP